MTRPLLSTLGIFAVLGLLYGFSGTLDLSTVSAQATADEADPDEPTASDDDLGLKLGAVEPDQELEGFAKFSHQTHTTARLKTQCIDCHRLGIDGNRFRPAPDDTCTACHIGDGMIEAFRSSWNERQAESRPKAERVEPIHRTHIYYDCDKCHRSIALSTRIGDMPLPPTDNTDESCIECHSRAVRFSHKAHIRVDGKVATDCSTCHQARCDTSEYTIPGHPQCWTCHDITLLALTEGCNLCHLADARAAKGFNVERATVLHQEHPRSKVPCEKCHSAILTADTLDEVRAARTSSATTSCNDCHTIPN